MKDLTAKVSCFARAYHSHVNKIRIFTDEPAYKLLGKDYDMIAESMMKGTGFFFPDFRGSPEEGLRLIVDRQLSPSVLVRSAFCEAKLKKETEGGCGQYVILAAGYDTFGIRNTDPSLKVFELDLPEMLADKEARNRDAGLLSSSVYVACDLAAPAWKEKLQEKGFAPDQKAFTSLLGISYYLDREEFRPLIEVLGDLLKEGSGICFDFPADEGGKETEINQKLAKGAGEAMKAKYSAEEMKELLDRCGFEIREFLGPAEMTEQYCSEYNDAVPEHRISAPEGVCYIFAVRKQ